MADYVCRGADQLASAAGVITRLSPAKVWRVSIAQYRSRRSSEQNARLWALYQAISKETGYAASEVHEICKAKFGEPKVIEIGGKSVTQYTTHEKDVEWFGRFMDQVEAWSAQELGVVLG